MKSLIHRVSLRIVKGLNVILIMVPIAVIWIEYYAKHSVILLNTISFYIVPILFMLIYVIYGRIYEGFLVSTAKISEIVYSQSLAAFISDVILYFVFYLMLQELPTIIPLIIAFAVQVLISIGWSYASHIWYFYMFPPKKTAIIFDRRQGMEELINMSEMKKKFEVLEIKSVIECIGNGMEFLNGMQVVFLCGVHSHERNVILKYCISNGIMVYVVPGIGDVIMSGAKPIHLFHLPLLRVGQYEPTPEYLFIKRTIDILISGAAIIVLSPVMFLTALAIKMTDGGPIFYKQRRLTKDGKEFYIIKFRSMRQDAEKDGVARLSTGDHDSRITPMGKYIRKVRIDELPQLFNILEGSMSIVGPRPERPEIAEQYERELPEFSLRLQAKAGLTGYAQVYGKYNTTPYDKLLMDLTYIANPSLLEDLRIMFATVKIIFVAESTEGIAEGKTTATDIRQTGEEKRDEIQCCDTSI